MNEDLVQPAVIEPKKKPVLLIIITILLLSSLSLSVFLLYQNFQLQKKIQTIIPQPTETFPPKLVDPTTNWKTYTNIAFKYSIKYPEDWKADSVGPGIGTIQLSDTARGLLLSPAPPISDINIQIEADLAKTSGQTYESWVNTTKRNLNESTLSTSEILLATTKSFVIQKEFSKVYLLSSPDKEIFYYIEVKSPTPDFQITLDQILSTFKFTP